MIDINNENKQIQELRELYETEENSQPFFRYLASRKKGRIRTCSVKAFHNSLIKQGSELTHSQVVKLFKHLDALGFGQFFVGRHGKPSRLRWKADSVSVGLAATRKADNIIWLENQVGDEVETGEEMELLTHTFRLRRNLTVNFTLPSDLTKVEAQRLAGFIVTLPFGEDLT